MLRVVGTTARRFFIVKPTAKPVRIRLGIIRRFTRTQCLLGTARLGVTEWLKARVELVGDAGLVVWHMYASVTGLTEVVGARDPVITLKGWFDHDPTLTRLTLIGSETDITLFTNWRGWGLGHRATLVFVAILDTIANIAVILAIERWRLEEAFTVFVATLDAITGI